jgi:hypothetical protein
MYATYSFDALDNEDHNSKTPIYLYFNSTFGIKVKDVGELELLNRIIMDCIEEIKKDISLCQKFPRSKGAIK